MNLNFIRKILICVLLKSDANLNTKNDVVGLAKVFPLKRHVCAYAKFGYNLLNFVIENQFVFTLNF